MSRIEELTLGYLDGELSPKEIEELEELLRDDAEARRAHLAILETARALRGAAPPADLAARVGGALAAASGRELKDGVLHRIDRRIWMKRGLAAAAALLAAVGIWSGLRPGVAGTFESAGQDPVAVREGGALRPGVAGRLVLAAGGEALLEAGAGLEEVRAAGLVLERGAVRVKVKRAFRVSTASARVEVVGTEFALRADGRWTSLQVVEGRVRFVRLSDGVASEVGAGGSAEAGGKVLAWRFEGDGKDGPGELWRAERVPGRIGSGIRCGAGGWVAEGVEFGDRWAVSVWLREAEIGKQACAYLTGGPSPGDLLIERVGTLSPQQVRVRAGGKSLTAMLPLKGGEWFQLGLSWDGQALRLLHDGREAGSLVLPGNPLPRPGLRLGASQVPGTFDADDLFLQVR